MTHPFHPLRGQQVEILCVYRRPSEPDLLVQVADGTTLCLAMSATNYADDDTLPDVKHLLTWEGLRYVVQFLEQKQGP